MTQYTITVTFQRKDYADNDVESVLMEAVSLLIEKAKPLGAQLQVHVEEDPQ